MRQKGQQVTSSNDLVCTHEGKERNLSVRNTEGETIVGKEEKEGKIKLVRSVIEGLRF